MQTEGQYSYVYFFFLLKMRQDLRNPRQNSNIYKVRYGTHIRYKLKTERLDMYAVHYVSLGVPKSRPIREPKYDSHTL